MKFLLLGIILLQLERDLNYQRTYGRLIAYRACCNSYYRGCAGKCFFLIINFNLYKEAWHNAGNYKLGGWGTLQTTSHLCDLFQFIYSDQLCVQVFCTSSFVCVIKKQNKTLISSHITSHCEFK